MDLKKTNESPPTGGSKRARADRAPVPGRVTARPPIAHLLLAAALAGGVSAAATAGGSSGHLAASALGHLVPSLGEIRAHAEQGDPEAQAILGLMYDAGVGVTEDDAQAVEWLRRAAVQGYALAWNHLGLMREFGNGVPEDHAQAAAWYREAAEQGFAPAQYHLGAMYAVGKGVPRDLAEAWRWHSLAAEGGVEEATRNLDELQPAMTSSERAEARRLLAEWREQHDR